jgi:hypothetical protein
MWNCCFLTSFKVRTGRPAATPVDTLPSIPGCPRTVRSSRSGNIPKLMTSGLQDVAASLRQEQIVLHDISKPFGCNLMFGAISFDITAGDEMALLGANCAPNWAQELRWHSHPWRLE